MALQATLYVAVLAAAFASSQVGHSVEARAVARRPATMTALLVVGVPSLVQLTVAPWLLTHLQRDWTAIGDGQVWRLVTSLVVQDGGLAGTVFNLVSLFVIGSAAEAVWDARQWVVLALVSGVGAQLWGWLVQPVGGGNSVAVFGLAGSLAVLELRCGTDVQRLLAATSLLAAAILLLAGDIHGGAATIGVVGGAVLSRTRRPASPSR
jgi:rhomboid protease GluP